MSALKKTFVTFLFLQSASLFLTASEEILIRLEGSYLAYSYDHNQIYGENVKFQFASYNAACRYLKIDINLRAFYAYGDVVLKKGNEELSGDEFLFNPLEKKGELISYGEKIEAKKIGNETGVSLLAEKDVLDELSLPKIQKSFLYFTGRVFEVTANFDVYGLNVTLFIEGLKSLGFKKFKLSGGINQRRSGISLDRIWYTKSQGLTGRVSYFYEKEKKVNSLTHLNYEEHSFLKNYAGLKRQVDLMSSTTLSFNENLSLGLSGNYNSSSLWNARLWLNRNWGKRNNALLDFSYNRPINLREETWLGLQSNIDAGKFGIFSFSGRYEIQNQMLTSFSYGNTFLKRISFLLSSSYYQVRMGRSPDYSKILSGGIDLSYSSRLFNLSTDYYLNYDLFGNQLLSQPQLRFGLNPFRFYGGLLSANIYNIFIYNDLKGDLAYRSSFSNNTIFNLSTQPIFLQRSFSLNFNIALEQFIEKEGRNFTSGGIIIKANKGLTKSVSLEGLYSVQSRRKTKNWLIEGTTSQDLSSILNFNFSGRLKGWLSLSFDPKNNQWRQSFIDLAVEIVKNWKLHSLFNYDFLLKKMNNIDLYLIREAGRFQLRFIWRSLSRQFVVELAPR